LLNVRKDAPSKLSCLVSRHDYLLAFRAFLRFFFVAMLELPPARRSAQLGPGFATFTRIACAT
jgi:hypothetical protein